MLILAGDTSNAACSCCLLQDNQVIAESFLSLGRTHSETFMPLVHELMHKAGAEYGDLDAFACSVGPGSFTGIRIGVTAVKMMAAVAGKPAVPVSSLHALVYPFLDMYGQVAAVIDARNRRVFASVYTNGCEAVAEDAMTVEDFARDCREICSGKELLLVGDAAEALADDPVWTDFQVHHAGDRGRAIHASSVAHIAAGKLLAARNSSPEEDGVVFHKNFAPERLLPVYRAKTSAERKFAQ